MKTKYRDCYCGKITKDNIGKTMKVSGFIDTIRDHGGVLFLDLRDESGTVQVVSNDDKIFWDLQRKAVLWLLV